jgi:integrase
MKVRLTDRFCSTAKSSAEAQTDYFDETVPGLALRVSGTTKAWSLLYSRSDGRRARMTLGRYPALSLAGARSAALEARSAIAEGRPIGTDTVAAVWAEYISREAPKLRSAKWRRTIVERHILPTLGVRPIGEVRRSEIVHLLDRIEDASGPSAAHVVLKMLGRLCNWHASRSDEFRSPIVRGMARINPKERERDRILSNDELRLVWAACSGVYGAFIRFLLLTAVRRSEAAGMQWSELSGSLWTIPAARMKGKVEHIVPLSAAALAILDERRSAAMPFGRSIASSQRKTEFDAIVSIAPWRLHDLRRTARSLMSRAGVNKDIAERCLAHAIGGVSGVYDRHAYLEEKKAAFDALAGLVQRIVDPQPNLVAIKGGERHG